MIEIDYNNLNPLKDAASLDRKLKLQEDKLVILPVLYMLVLSQRKVDSTLNLKLLNNSNR